MAKPSEHSIPEFYQPYIRIVEDKPIAEVLKNAEKKTIELLFMLSDTQSESAYQEGKWTIKEIVQHLIDAEVVFTYRALWLARNSGIDLPGFEHNDWVEESHANDFIFSKLLQDFTFQRASTIATFSKFNDNDLKRKGQVNGYKMSPEILGYLIAGHNLHHLNIIKERYL